MLDNFTVLLLRGLKKGLKSPYIGKNSQFQENSRFKKKTIRYGQWKKRRTFQRVLRYNLTFSEPVLLLRGLKKGLKSPFIGKNIQFKGNS